MLQYASKKLAKGQGTTHGGTGLISHARVLSTKDECPPPSGSALHQTPPPTWPARRNARATGDGLGPSTLTLAPAPTAPTGSLTHSDTTGPRRIPPRR